MFLWLFGLAFTLGNGNFTEEYSLLFDFLALYLFMLALQRPNAFRFYMFIGITGGCVFLLRPNNVGGQITIGLTTLLLGLLRKDFRKTVKRLCMLGIGMLFPILVTVIFFALNKALPNMINAVFTYNFSYSSSHIKIWTSLGSGFIAINVVALVALAGYIKTICGIKKNDVTRLDEWHCILILGWPIEILLSALSGRVYLHYFICWLPMMALLGTYSFISFGNRI